MHGLSSLCSQGVSFHPSDVRDAMTSPFQWICYATCGHYLQSSGIAPNNDTTWQLLKAFCQASQLSHTSNSCLPTQHLFHWSRTQYYINPLPLLICCSLRQVINILIARKAPYLSVKFLRCMGPVLLPSTKSRRVAHLILG